MVLIIAALAPAIFLMRVIYKQDKIEKEPGKLLAKLILGGCLAAIPAMILEEIGEIILLGFFDENGFLYAILDCFLVVGFAEEGSKYFFLKKFSWKNPAFNYRFDGIVYAVFTSLGFAALENIGYVTMYGLGTAVTRAVLSIPGHMCFSVFMGYFYGRARLWSNIGDEEKSKEELKKGIVSAALVHGLYDACLSVESTFATILFVVVVIVMDVFIYRLVKLESKTDAPIA